MPTRRFVLSAGGASAVILASGGCGRADLDRARAPWSAAGRDFADPRLNALSYAVLAPSPHNRQPWIIRLDGDDAATVFCDPERLLPQTDPPNRQIVIGFGAFLELLRQAAAERGDAVDVTPFPEGEPQPTLDARPIAAVRFRFGAAPPRDPLFGAALARRTARTPFAEDRPVTDAMLRGLANDAFDGPSDAFAWTVDRARAARLAAICKRAWRIEVATDRTLEESVRLTRIGAREIAGNPDGISLSGAPIDFAAATGLLTREKMLDPASTAYAQTLSVYERAIDSAPAFGWIISKETTRRDELKAGAAWVRLHLAAQRAGLAFHPLSQALQEFPEMSGPYTDLHDMLGVAAPARIQGFFRFGFAKFPPPAPRWALETRLASA
ncbi:MAG: twin-arginine translocation pathway signal protein [Pseudomonadota bacterium]